MRKASLARRRNYRESLARSGREGGGRWAVRLEEREIRKLVSPEVTPRRVGGSRKEKLDYENLEAKLKGLGPRETRRRRQGVPREGLGEVGFAEKRGYRLEI